VVCVPIVPVLVPVEVPVVAPVVPGLPAVPDDPVLPPVVWAVATPSARNKTDEAKKYLDMESPLVKCTLQILAYLMGCLDLRWRWVINRGTQQPMQPIDLTAVLKGAPVGDWIALSHAQDRIVATAKTLDEAVRTAKVRGENDPVVLKIPPVNSLIL
jgi:hypothetical protein